MGVFKRIGRLKHIRQPMSMPFSFHGARHIDASNSHFNAVGQDQYNFNFNFRVEDDAVASLKPTRSSFVQPCMPGTRQWMIDKIHDWLDDHQVPNILLLTGSPGAGKSTIASTLVSNLQEARRYGSSFFCKRDDVSLSDPAACWRTIAFDLAKCDSIIIKKVVENIRDRKVDPGRADIELHFKYLIEDPLREVWRSRTAALGENGGSDQSDELSITGLPVVVLDALDECGSDGPQSAQRQSFINTLIQWSRLPKSFKLVVTSRDHQLPDSFIAVCHQLVLDTGDIASPESIDDIRIFIEKRFAAIATRNRSLPPTWPGESILKQLTCRAAGLFVWADTMVKFVEQGIPNKRLQSILQDPLHHVAERLDILYRQVMVLPFKDSTDDELEIYKSVIGAVVLAKIPLCRRDLRHFLGRDEEEASITSILLNLSSVISIGADELVHVSHLSFTEFICDPDRCGERFAIYRCVHDRIMALSCLQVMQTELRFNICQLETSHVRNADVLDLTSRIKKFIPSHLSYSCRFWSDHLQTTTVDVDAVEAVKHFLHTHLLYWLEVLSLQKEVNIASQVLMSARKWIGVSPSITIRTW